MLQDTASLWVVAVLFGATTRGMTTRDALKDLLSAADPGVIPNSGMFAPLEKASLKCRKVCGKFGHMSRDCPGFQEARMIAGVQKRPQTSIPARLAIPQVPPHQNCLVTAAPGSDESMNLRPRISYVSGWRSGEGGVRACAHAAWAPAWHARSHPTLHPTRAHPQTSPGRAVVRSIAHKRHALLAGHHIRQSRVVPVRPEEDRRQQQTNTITGKSHPAAVKDLGFRV